MGSQKRVKDQLKKVLKYIEYKQVLPLVYRWYCRRPIDDRLVVFADHRNRDAMPDNFVGLYEMCNRDGFRCEVLAGSSFGKETVKWRRWKALLRFQFRFMKLYAQCRVLFLVDHFPLSDIVKPRPGVQVVQLWHGCGIMKRMGYAVTSKCWGAGAMSQREKELYPLYVSCTLICVSSAREKVRAGYCEAFRHSWDTVKPLGMPRTDIYFDDVFRANAKEKAHSLFPEIGNRKIILYAPTYRGKSIAQSYTQCNLEIGKLKEALSKEYVFLTKFHPLMARGGFSENEYLQGREFVFDVSRILTPEEALCAADVLVTDYSSIIFEYLLLERPVISYVYDLQEYVEKRGLFLPYDQLAPGPYVYTQEELTEKLLTVEEWFDADRIRMFKDEFMSACDGHSTQRIYDYVFHPMAEDKEQIS